MAGPGVVAGGGLHQGGVRGGDGNAQGHALAQSHAHQEVPARGQLVAPQLTRCRQHPGRGEALLHLVAALHRVLFYM